MEISLTGNVKKDAGMQLYFFDDGSFKFRRLDIVDTFLVEKKDGRVHKAWMDLFKLRKRFDGFKNLTAGMYTMSYGRDILLDPFNQIKDSFAQAGVRNKLSKGGGLKQPYVSRIAESKCYKHEHGKKQSPMIEKTALYLFALMLLLGIGIVISAVT